VTARNLPSLADLYRKRNPNDAATTSSQVWTVSNETLSRSHFELLVAWPLSRDRHRPEAVMFVDMERVQRIVVALVDTAAEA
jgi:hypothetical protein